ncbi:MAG: YidC/Oxa1 family membrane protein insertase [Spirochaetaceae bacterium]|jgi:membrane protein insertase Oxa1/YidC/SpoIIIJ|nr:YidC/Oxa1 family membrane protein insertase [Spirochaetaceae bacterium]
MFIDGLYTILIEPIIQIIEVIFMIFSRMLNNGMAVVVVSVAISLLTHPFYMMAEKWRQVERGTQARLARKLRVIKSVFSGDERHLLITACYRQNHYHPVYGLRNSIGLFIQIPFFMAAYICLSNLQVLKGEPFLFIKDLGMPDALIPLWGGVNLLPIVMTLVNCAAAAVYTKGLPKKDAAQLYLMAAVFLALLYDSPAGLVLYWTCNNLFSLAKNIALRVSNSTNKGGSLPLTPAPQAGLPLPPLRGDSPPQRPPSPIPPEGPAPEGIIDAPPPFPAFGEMENMSSSIFDSPVGGYRRNLPLRRHQGKPLWGLVCAVSLSAAFYLLFIFDKGYYVKRAALSGCFILVCFFPAFAALARKIERKYVPASLYAARNGPLFAASALILWVLAGIAIPSGLIGSSVEEFSFIEPFASPVPFVSRTALQAAGIFLLWPAVVYALFSPKVRFYGTLFLAAAGFIALLDTYLFAGNYGYLTITLTLSNDEFSQPFFIVLLEIALVVLAAVGAALLFIRKRKWLFSVQIIALLSLCAFSVFNIVKIQRDFTRYRGMAVESEETLTPVFTFSKTENNVLVVMLDRALSPFIPTIFAEKPELNETLSGFTWYPNCVSLGPVTISAVPSLFGGYEYAPALMGTNNGTPLVEKHNEALLVMPRVFSEHGFRVTVSDPSWANYNYKSDISIYEPYPAIDAVKIIGKYTKHWLEKNRDVRVFDASAFLQYNLLRFSFLRIAPPFLRFFVYDGGRWLAKIGETNRDFSLLTLDEYTALDVLPEITAVDEGEGTLAIITNQLTHEPAFLQAPAYRPAAAVTDRGSGPYAGDAAYHANIAALLLLSRYFAWLKEHDAYDNTRIIITADHGWGSQHDFEGNITLPNGKALVNYNPLYLVKDFNARGPLAVDQSFMTNADTPSLAVEGLIPDPRNPWTGNPIQPDKDNGVTITTSGSWSPDGHAKYAFKIAEDEYLTVHTDIFDPANWSKGKKPTDETDDP